jgi:hypothetical protein
MCRVIKNQKGQPQMKTKYLAAATCLLLMHAHAQNLVTNSGFEAGNTGFASDYTLWPGPAINPNWGQNQYYVTNNPHNAYSAWASSGDHTTGSGQMLIVDGSTTTGRAFWRQTVAVTTNTFYVFSAGALKFDSDSPPILYFTVNGTQQGTFYVLPLTPSGWQGYGVTWNSGASNTAVLELRLQSNKAGPGNNIAVDDIALIRSADIPATSAFIESAVQIGWASYPGSPYQVQWAPDVTTNTTWLNLGSSVLGTGTTNYLCDPIGGRARRFYQVIKVH